MYKHYLNFIDLPLIGKIEISEPFKFDGSTHEIKREKGRHSRDVIISNQDIELEFYREVFEPIEVPQVLPDSTILNYVTHGFDYLVNEINTKGWEIRVEYTINYNGTDFTTGEIDGLTYKVFDDYLSIKISQNTLHAYIKKNDSVKIDAFSNKSLTGLPITPCSTTDIFLKAKPILQKSKWGEKTLPLIQNTGTATNAQISIPISNALVDYRIENSYAPFDPFFKGLDVSFSENNDFRYANRLITATTDLSGITLKINKLNVQGFANFGTFTLNISRAIFDSDGDWVENVGTTIQPINSVGSVSIVNQDFVIPIPDMSDGESLIVSMDCFFATSGLVSFDQKFLSYSVESVEISLTSTAISTIVKGIRLHDLLRHQAHSYDTTLNDLGVFNNTSEYWNNFCFNGRMLGNLANQDFNNEFKKLYQSVCDEAFADYQIDNSGITIDFIDNYYKDE